MKTNSVPIGKIHKAIFGRLQRCVAHLHIWAAFEMRSRRPRNFQRAERYSNFFDWIPDAAIFSFVVRTCSLFDTGADCITLESYAKAIKKKVTIPPAAKAKIEAAAIAVEPLRKVRNTYYAHRLAEGTFSNLFKEHKLTCNKLFSIMELTREAAIALCELTSQEPPPLYMNPQKGLSRLLADLP